MELIMEQFPIVIHSLNVGFLHMTKISDCASLALRIGFIKVRHCY